MSQGSKGIDDFKYEYATCGCGHEVVLTPDGWEHNVAPWFHGDDHDPDPCGPPSGSFPVGRFEVCAYNTDEQDGQVVWVVHYPSMLDARIAGIGLESAGFTVDHIRDLETDSRTNWTRPTKDDIAPLLGGGFGE